MANSDKDILITPNKGTSSIPEVSFVGQVNSPIKLRVLDDNTLSFEGSAGQLFSINNNLTVGTIFAVSDVSGVPSLSVNANGLVAAAPFNGFLTVGAGSFTTDRQLAVRGSIIVANRGTTPAQLEFTEIANSGGNINGTAPARIYYDGPNYSDNNNYLSISTAGSDRLTVTYGGGVGINTNNPRTRLQIVGDHTTTSWRLTLPSGNNGGGTGEVSMQAWVSEPGITWDGAGLGSNVTNYTIAAYPTASYDTSLGYFPRINTSLGQAYIRFMANGGRMYFTTTDNNGTTYQNQIQMGGGCLGINGLDTNYKLYVGGSINFTGTLYQNGSVFKTLPTQSSSTIGAVLMSDGTNAFWDVAQNWSGTFVGSTGGTVTTLPYNAEDRYRVGFQISRGYAMAGYQNSTSYKNVCSINHGTITLQNHGDLLTNGQGYCAGGRNLSMRGYVFIAVNGVGGTGSTCSKIDMNTNTNAGTTSISISRSSTTIMQRDFKYAYVYGGGDSRPDRFNYANDTSALIANGNPEGNVNNPAGGYGATYGWTKNGAGYNFSWAAETYAVWPNAPGTDGTNKTLSARHGFAYWNTAGGYTTAANLSKRSLVTGAEATQVTKFNSGEETWHTGISKGFMCGMYNGAQNNTGVVVDYAAETFVANSNINRVGPPGSASGAGTEFGAVLTGYDGI